MQISWNNPAGLLRFTRTNVWKRLSWSSSCTSRDVFDTLRRNSGEASANRTSETIANWIFKSVFVYSQSVRNILRPAHVSTQHTHTQTTWYNTELVGRSTNSQSTRNDCFWKWSDSIFMRHINSPRHPSSEPPNSATYSVNNLEQRSTLSGRPTQPKLVALSSTDIDINRRSGSQTVTRYCVALAVDCGERI